MSVDGFRKDKLSLRYFAKLWNWRRLENDNEGHAMRISDHEVLTFDCYGTLIDWETGILRNLSGLVNRAAADLMPDAVLESHAYHESEQQAATPGMGYSKLLAVVYKRLAEEWNVRANWDECLAYGNSVGSWPAFEDSAAALADLKKRFKLVILSNVDNAGFTKSNLKLGVEFDAVFTAEDIGSYKPAIRNFEYMLSHLERQGVKANKVLHVAESLFHDHAPARSIGLSNCWINRRKCKGKDGFGATRPPGTLPQTDMQFLNMSDFVNAILEEC